MVIENNSTMPRVLVCGPQHESKNYAWDKWANNVKNFTYPNFDVFLSDNSDNDKNTKMIKDFGFSAEHVQKNKKGIIFTMKDSHEQCRQKAISGGYDYMLHLETDVIPPIDVIERLLHNRKKVCGAVYDLFHGKKRKLMVQLDDPASRSVIAYRNPAFVEEQEPLFIDGSCKPCYHVGLGCVLIHKHVFTNIPFRADENANLHPDTWFANDCFLRKQPIYVDTAIHCLHLNKSWVGKSLVNS